MVYLGLRYTKKNIYRGWEYISGVFSGVLGGFAWDICM